MLGEDEVEASARANGWRLQGMRISRQDIDRLKLIEQHEGEYRLVDHAATDMRTLELVLLLNEAR